MTWEILRKIKKRDRIAKIKNRIDDYRHLRNEIVKDCRKAERNYLNKKINENMNNIKEHWKILKKTMGKTNDKSNFPSAFKQDGMWITDKKQTADSMNSFYAKVGPETNAKVGCSKNHPNFYLDKYMQQNIECIIEETFNENDVKEASKSLN